MNRLLKRGLLTAILLIALAFLIAVMWPMDGGVRVPANQASAVNSLAAFNKAQIEFAKANLNHGFSCNFEGLKSFLRKDGQDFGPTSFYLDGLRSGYIFTLSGCAADPAHAAMHYQITAVPRLPGQSGDQSFCTNESGVIWHEPSGSSEDCFANRKPLE